MCAVAPAGRFMTRPTFFSHKATSPHLLPSLSLVTPPPSILFSITCPSPQVAHCFTPTSRALPTAHLVQHVWVDGGRLHFTPFLTSFYLWGWATCWDANNLLNNLSAEAGNSRWRTHHLKHSHKKNNYRHTNTVILDVCLSKDLEPYQWLCNVAIWDNGGLISCHFVCVCVFSVLRRSCSHTWIQKGHVFIHLWAVLSLVSSVD